MPIDLGPGGTDILDRSGNGNGVDLNSDDVSREVINLFYNPYNAPLNGVDDDLPAFTAAVNSLPANGGTIEWSGYLRFNSPYVAPAGRSHIKLKPLGYSPIYNPVHGFNFITLPGTTAFWKLDGLSFFADAATGSTEVFMLVSDCDNLVTRDIAGLGVWSGLKLTGTKQFILGRTYIQDIKSGVGRICVIDQNGKEICEVENLVGLNATDCAAGVEINSGAAIRLGGTIAKGGIPLLFNPALGQVIATVVLNEFNGDTSSGHGGLATGAGTIQRVRGSATFSGCAGSGFRVDNPIQSSDVWLRLQHNILNGLTLAGINHYESRFNLAAFGNGVNGWEALNNANKFNINSVCGAGDGFGGNLGYGGVIGTGCTDFTADINGSGNVLGILNNASGTSATKVVRTRG